MRVIPVIDLLNGVVVRGIAGRRETYRPMQSEIAADWHPATIARAFVEGFGFDAAYVADIDAIQYGRLSIDAWQQVARAGLKMWLDAGIGNAAAAQRIADTLAEVQIDARLVVGLESLESADELMAIQAVCSGRLPIFSLDLKAGRPLTRIDEWQNCPPLELAQKVVAAGFRDLIVLDLGDVGTNAGTNTLELCRRIRTLGIPPLNLIAGGGVRSIHDLQRMQSAGCDAALVASALHDKRLTPAELRQLAD